MAKIIAYKVSNLRDLQANIENAIKKKWEYLIVSGRSDMNFPKIFNDKTTVHQLDFDHFSPDLGELGKIISLRGLAIASTYRISHIPEELGYLKNLEILQIENNDLSAIPQSIFKLENLIEINVSRNKINQLPFSRLSWNLTRLKVFNASSNQLSYLPKLDGLKFLEKLYLSQNNFSEFPFEIFTLANLKLLDLYQNAIKILPPEIVFLENLEQLFLSRNKISQLPSELGFLKKLREFKAADNLIELIPSKLCNATELRYLDLGNGRSKFASHEENLKTGNQINTIPKEIGKLVRLERLILSDNKISDIPKEIKEIHGLREFDIQGNPLPIPPEIINVTDDPRVILEYFFALSVTQRKQLNEIKLIIVGQGSVGKTSLITRILYDLFEDQGKTEGISITQWEIDDVLEKQQKIRINTWDFGGQEIMHATHQFFLTKRSLYLLVLDSRLTQEENRVEYWLKIIQSFGGDSPVLIVGNKIDQHPLDIDRTGLQKKYPNIVGIFETSAASGAGIEELKQAITGQVNNLPHVRDLLPETWFTVKTALEGLGRESNFITHDKYLELCAENEVSDETSQRTLIGFLHDLGVVLHFQDDPRLEALGILNPQWVTNGVYKILNSHTLFQNKGVLTVAMLDEILNLPEYPRGKRLFIVDMMKKFELCYDIEPDKTFLVPDLLPKDQPDLNFNGIPAFEYAYPVLPSSVITRFIVRMNQKIDDGFVWRTGVVLKIGANKALVKADIEDKKITIAIDGLEHTRRDALSAIRYQLDEIHASIKGLNPQKRVPIPNAPRAEALDYDYLLQLERDGDLEVLPIKDGNRLVKVNIRELLSGIESEAQRRETGGNVTTNIYVGGNFDGNLTVGNDNQSIKDSYNKISAAKIDPELKATLQELAQAVAVMVQSLPKEQATEIEDDLGELVEEVTRPTPRQKWYSVSIEGLIKAAENLDKLGTPVISLSKKVLSLLTGGMVQ
jgi:internalin A